MDPWPAAVPLETARLRLEPLTVEHATEMVDVLADPSIYEYVGGTAPTAAQLSRRYARQIVGRSPDGRQGWLNWIVRRRDRGEAIGFIQATVSHEGGRVVADIAWVLSPRHRGAGFATEAAAAMGDWLRRQRVELLAAYISPANEPSIGLARRLGLHVTDVTADGESRWES